MTNVVKDKLRKNVIDELPLFITVLIQEKVK